MSNPENDSRLEHLSREAADRYTVKASPSWDKMEKELDQVLPTEKKKKRPFILWWVIPGMLLIGSTLWYSLSSLENKQATTTPTTVSSMHNKERVTETPTTSTIEEEKTTSTPIKSEPTSKNNRYGNTQFEQPLEYSHTKIQASNSLLVQKQEIATQQKTIDSSVTALSVQKNTADITADKASAENASFIRATIDSGSSTTDKSILTKTDSTIVSITHTKEPITVISKDSILPNNKKEKGLFSLALTAGMDATTVRFRYTDKASLSGGIIIGYHLNRNWSIHTGALYTRKNYKMAGSDFKAPAGSWVANYKLETVDGFCNMWEVPLVFRYTFDNKTKARAFVSSGLSSYFMTRENYNYFYYYNGLPVRRNANYPNGKTHLFSILKLSAGWIRDMNKNTSLTVEPFANLPFSGLGFGNVRLSSFGVNFSYQFRQPNKKK